MVQEHLLVLKNVEYKHVGQRHRPQSSRNEVIKGSGIMLVDHRKNLGLRIRS